MMKSVALMDSVQNEEDFVLVDVIDDASISHSSYDCCDDAYSLHSAPQSLAIDSNAFQTFHDEFFEAPLLRSFDDDLSCIESSAADVEILLQGISSMMSESDFKRLMPEPSYAEGINYSGNTWLASEGRTFGSPTSRRMSDVQASLLACDSAPPMAQRRQSGSSVSTQTTLSSSENEDEGILGASLYNNSAGVDVRDDITCSMKNQSALSGGSRLSNKKRRKQMKLAQKAAAAAAAAAALSHLSIAATRMSPARSKQIRRHIQKTNRKQVTNLAVACATESIGNYKEQCLLKSKKPV